MEIYRMYIEKKIQLVKQKKKICITSTKYKTIIHFVFPKTMRNLSTLLAINFQRPPPPSISLSVP